MSHSKPVSNGEIIAMFNEISQGVDTKYAKLVVEQIANDLGPDVSEERIITVLGIVYGDDEPVWKRAKMALEPILRMFSEETTPSKNEGFVYLLKQCGSEDGQYKLGKSKDPQGRVGKLNRSIPPDGRPLEIFYAKSVLNYDEAEQELHQMFADKRISSDTGGEEWFALSDKDIEYIKEYLNDKRS